MTDTVKDKYLREEYRQRINRVMDYIQVHLDEELYLNDPEQHPEHKCIVDICVPVKPL